MAARDCPVGAVGLPVETAESVIQGIFVVGLSLAACAEQVHGPAAERLAAAVEDLDDLIFQIRKAVLDGIPVVDGGGPQPAGEPPSDLQQLVDRLVRLPGDLSTR